MDPTDDGYFQYDQNFPPLCVRPPHTLSVHDFGTLVRQDIDAYINESCMHGIKDSGAVLPCGLTVGEAALIRLRSVSCCAKENPAANTLATQIEHGLRSHMDIDVERWRTTFNKYISMISDSRRPNTDLHMRQFLTTLLKAFLQEINMKTRGYTRSLRMVIDGLHI
jgi:hypothetical protein